METVTAPSPTLDLFTLAALAGVLAVVLSGVLLVMRHAYPRQVRGMLLWSLAPLTGAMVPLLFVLGHAASETLTLLGGHGLMLITALLFYFGSQRFLGREPAWGAWGLFVAATLLLVTCFLIVWPDFRLRMLVFVSASALIAVVHARLLWRSGMGFAARFTAAVLGAKALMLVARGATALALDTPTTSILVPTTAQAAYIASHSVSALLTCLGVILMISERLRAEFEHLASHDALTGALSRRSAEDSLRHEFDRWHRYGQTFSVLMFDVDHFKRINDTHGHQTGDRVLMEVVRVTRQTLRTTDRLGRYGGEEFLVVLPETGLAAAIQAAERIRQALYQRASTIERPGCSVSVGVAAVADDATVDVLLSRADAALYSAKAAGRNRVIWDPREGAAHAPPQPETSAA